MPPSHGKSHLSLLKPTPDLQGLLMGQLKELALKLSVSKLSYLHIVEKPVS